MSQCTLQSNRPKTIIRKGNDTPLHIALTTDKGDTVDLAAAQNLSVSIVSARTGRVITPPYQITTGGGLSLEFSAPVQELGIYGLRVQFDLLSEGFADGLQAYAWEDTNLIEVVPTSTALPTDTPNTISGQLAALSKGDKGDPGNPMELLDELSRQQSDRLNEIATAQRESLTSIGARLSDEQRTALEELAGRLSREQGDKIAQQTERLSSEQASGLQVISDRLSSEYSQTLERQGQERATAQAGALQALDEQVNHKYDAAIGAIPAKVTDEVGRLMSDAVSGRIGGEVQAQLPAVVAQQIPGQMEEQLPAQVESRLPDLVDGRLPEAVDGKLPDVIDAKLPPLVDERISGAVETAMPNQLTTALPPVVRAELPSAIRGELPALVRPAVQPAVEQVMATDLASRVAQGLQIGTRNMIKGSNGRRVLPSSDTNRHNALGYTIIPSRVSTHDSYALSATVEVLSGEANLIAAYIYNGHKPVNTVYDMSIGGPQRLTWVFRGNTDAPAVYTSHPIYIYAGVNGNTIGVSIAVSDVILVSGDTPLLSWTPSPEDVQTMLLRDRIAALSHARGLIWAQYGKIAPNSALSSEAQSAVQRLWTNYDGAYNRLRTTLEYWANNARGASYLDVGSLSDQYQTAASDLQAGMTEAMLSLSPAGQIDYDTLAQSITGSIALDSESRLTLKGQPIGESLRGPEGRSAILSVAGVRPVQDRPDHSGVYRRNRRDTAYSPDLGTPESQGYALFPNTQRYYQSHIMGASNMDFLWLYTPPADHSSLVMIVQSQSRSGATPTISYKTSTGVVRAEGQVLRGAGTLTHYIAACALHDVVGQIWITMTSGDPGGDTGMYSMALYRMSIDEAPRIRGTWAQRPKTPHIGQQYIATDMRRNGVGDLPMWYNGQMWIDYEGHDVTRRYLAEG